MTLLEILLSVSILATSLIIVYQPLLGSLNALRYADNRLEAEQYLTDQIFELESRSVQLKDVPDRQQETVASEDGWNFDYQMVAQPLTEDNQLYSANFRVAWLQSGREKSVAREVYIKMPYEEKPF